MTISDAVNLKYTLKYLILYKNKIIYYNNDLCYKNKYSKATF